MDREGAVWALVAGSSTIDPEFLNQYTRAKDESAHAHSERILEVIDKVLNEELNPNAARVAMDGLKWIAARMMPKRYGDRVDVNLTGDINVIVDRIKEPS